MLQFALCVISVAAAAAASSFGPDPASIVNVTVNDQSRGPGLNGHPPPGASSTGEGGGLENWIGKYIENHIANPIYNAAHELNSCEKGLRDVHFNRDDFTYIAVAKAATREIHNQLCQRSLASKGLVIDEMSGLSGQAGFEKLHKLCAKSTNVHHMHKCTARDLQRHGAQHLIVPLRAPVERFESLFKMLTYGTEKDGLTHHEKTNAFFKDNFGTTDPINTYLDALRNEDDAAHELAMSGISYTFNGLVGLKFYLQKLLAQPIAIYYVCAGAGNIIEESFVNQLVENNMSAPPLANATRRTGVGQTSRGLKPISLENGAWLNNRILALDHLMFNTVCQEQKRKV
jgi:hypothetical protein